MNSRKTRQKILRHIIIHKEALTQLSQLTKGKRKEIVGFLAAQLIQDEFILQGAILPPQNAIKGKISLTPDSRRVADHLFENMNCESVGRWRFSSSKTVDLPSTNIHEICLIQKSLPEGSFNQIVKELLFPFR